MKKILIVGLGNVLLQDEGIGVHVLEQLEKEGGLPEGVELLRGETGGLALLPFLEEASGIIFVDAADFDGGAAGEIRIFRSSEIEKARCTLLSVHDVGLQDIIALLDFKKPSPPEVIVVGIKPKEIKVGNSISPDLEKIVPLAITKIRKEVARLILHQHLG